MGGKRDMWADHECIIRYEVTHIRAERAITEARKYLKQDMTCEESDFAK